MIFHQLSFDFAVRIPFTGLISAEVAEHKLRSFLLIELAVVLRNLGGTVGSLVVHMISVPVGVNEPQIQAHLPRHICGNEHLGFLLPFGERCAAEQFRITRLGKLHQLGDKLLLFGCGRYVVHNLIFLRSVDADVFCRPVIGDLSVERCQLRHFDKIAETLFLYDFVSDGKLIVHRLLGEDGSPRVKGLDLLCFEGLGTQILEQQVQLRK